MIACFHKHLVLELWMLVQGPVSSLNPKFIILAPKQRKAEFKARSFPGYTQTWLNGYAPEIREDLNLIPSPFQ